MDDIITKDGDLEILDGDLKVDFGDHQNIEHILRANPGDFKETPLLGVALSKTLNSPAGIRAIKKEIRTQLVADGFKVEEIIIGGDSEVTISAKRLS